MQLGADFSQRSRPSSNKASFTLVLPMSRTATVWLIVKLRADGISTSNITDVSWPDCYGHDTGGQQCVLRPRPAAGDESRSEIEVLDVLLREDEGRAKQD